MQSFTEVSCLRFDHVIPVPGGNRGSIEGITQQWGHSAWPQDLNCQYPDQNSDNRDTKENDNLSIYVGRELQGQSRVKAVVTLLNQS